MVRKTAGKKIHSPEFINFAERNICTNFSIHVIVSENFCIAQCETMIRKWTGGSLQRLFGSTDCCHEYSPLYACPHRNMTVAQW